MYFNINETLCFHAVVLLSEVASGLWKLLIFRLSKIRQSD